MKKSILVLVSLLVIASVLLSACATSTASANNHVNLNDIPDKGQPVNSVKAATPVVPAAATPTPTPIPTAQTLGDYQFEMLNDAVIIPDGERDHTEKWLSPLNGQYYFIQKFFYTSGGCGFAIYRGTAIWVKAPVGTNNVQGTPVASEEVIVPTGKDIGLAQFFFEAVPVTWAHASDFTTGFTLSNDPWYQR